MRAQSMQAGDHSPEKHADSDGFNSRTAYGVILVGNN
jgi:hypothetical protein